jgi:FKBP-type peptidyl-prolyl cis-trans isomerase
MRTLLAGLLFASFTVTVSGAATPTPDPLATDDAKTLYSIGIVVGRNLSPFALTPAELAIVKAGIDAQVNGTKPAVDLSVYGPKIQPFAAARQHAVAEREEAAGAAYLDKAARESGATRTPSGAVVETLTAGTGANPTADDRVTVQYEGRLIDGTVFDSSRSRGEPATMALKGVMKVGGKSRVVCPANLAYGERGSGPLIRPGSTLVFDIELIDIPAAAAATPPAAAAPPAARP